MVSSPGYRGKNHNIETAAMFYENVAKYKYLGTKVTNQHFFMRKIKNKLNMRNVYYH
jgi:hypothetical protein